MPRRIISLTSEDFAIANRVPEVMEHTYPFSSAWQMMEHDRADADIMSDLAHGWIPPGVDAAVLQFLQRRA